VSTLLRTMTAYYLDLGRRVARPPADGRSISGPSVAATW
jgi:hypothetical protein